MSAYHGEEVEMEELKKYVLEIYGSDSTDTAWIILQSDKPFLSIHAGDLINPRAWGETAGTFQDLLRVVSVEHIVWYSKKIEDTRHKLCIFTEAVDDTKQVRLAK
ncbi:MAG: hypothetical protein QOJ70_3045 [Acidobacteriota bacterium]|nr:hypothetical protein [Acidobacteriota bacterium]